MFPQIVQTFEPHLVQYSNTNPLIAEADGKHGDDIQWKVSSYMDLDRANEGAKQKEVICAHSIKRQLIILNR